MTNATIKDTVKVGDVFVTTWGGMVDAYQVTAVTGKATVKVRQIKTESLGRDASCGGWTVRPVPGSFRGEETSKRGKFVEMGGKPQPSIQFGRAASHKWDGERVYVEA